MGLKVLLDTDTVVAAVQGRLPVVLQLAQLKPAEVAVSVLSRVEAEGSLRRTGVGSARFARLLKDFLTAAKVLDFCSAAAQQAVVLAPYLPQGAQRLTATELYLAATALRHQVTLITFNPNRYALLPGLRCSAWR